MWNRILKIKRRLLPLLLNNVPFRELSRIWGKNPQGLGWGLHQGTSFWSTAQGGHLLNEDPLPPHVWRFHIPVCYGHVTEAILSRSYAKLNNNFVCEIFHKKGLTDCKLSSMTKQMSSVARSFSSPREKYCDSERKMLYWWPSSSGICIVCLIGCC